MSNSVAGSLLTDVLQKTAVTVLRDHLAPLSSFSIQYDPDEYKPLATAQIKLTTVASTPLTISQGTSFEQGDSTVTNIAVTPAQYAQSFQISNTDLQSGLRLADLVEANAKSFAEKLLDTVFALVTEGNFGAAVATSSAAAFDWPDIPALWASLKKSDKKSLVLDSEFFARLLNKPTFFQSVGPGPAGYKTFGLDGLYPCSRFSAAGSGVSGFLCNPQAICVVAGLPAAPMGFGQVLARQTFELPGLGLTVAAHSWFSLSTRTSWASYDSIFGAAVGDSSALKILKST